MGHKCCTRKKVKRGLWSPEEDEKLHKFVTTHPHHGSWSSVPKLAGLQRCGKSCRLRWINYLRPDVKRGSFSDEEERTIIEVHRILGNKWAQIAKHLPGRTDNEVKNLWNSCIKKKLISHGLDPTTHNLLTSSTHNWNSSSIKTKLISHQKLDSTPNSSSLNHHLFTVEEATTTTSKKIDSTATTTKSAVAAAAAGFFNHSSSIDNNHNVANQFPNSNFEWIDKNQINNNPTKTCISTQTSSVASSADILSASSSFGLCEDETNPDIWNGADCCYFNISPDDHHATTASTNVFDSNLSHPMELLQYGNNYMVDAASTSVPQDDVIDTEKFQTMVAGDDYFDIHTHHQLSDLILGFDFGFVDYSSEYVPSTSVVYGG